MASDELITVVIVDDHPALVAGVEAWCAAADPPIQAVASGPDVGAAWTDPGASADVVVFDLQLGDRKLAFGDLRRLVSAGRQVIVYTMHEDKETLLTCLDIGAFGYLTKNEGRVHLVEAIRAAVELRPYTPPTMAGAIGTDTRKDRPRLAPREVDVLLNWFACESKDMVAQKLGLSPRTVGGYIDRVRIKYANAGRTAPTKAALVARALQDGLIELDEL